MSIVITSMVSVPKESQLMKFQSILVLYTHKRATSQRKPPHRGASDRTDHNCNPNMTDQLDQRGAG